MAIFLARGGRWVTTCPPMRISPAVGFSRPAIICMSVVLPHPEGPSSTKNSPSLVARSTPSTAGTSPKYFWILRTSTVAMLHPCVHCNLYAAPRLHFAFGLPFLEDAFHFLICLVHGVFWCQFAGGRLRKHRRDHPGTKNLVDGGVGIARIAHVCSPFQAVLEHLVFIGRMGFGIVRNKALQVRHSLREAGEIVILTGQESLLEIADIVHQELLGTVDIFGKLPDDIDVHDVFEPQAPHRTFGGLGQPDIVCHGNLLIFASTRNRDGIRSEEHTSELQSLRHL